MANTRLILVEGLPGTGKSTNAYFLFRQLEGSGKKVRWFHEVARPHPVLFYDEACLPYKDYESIAKAYPQSAVVLDQIAVFRETTVELDMLELEWNHLGAIGPEVLEKLRTYTVCMKHFPDQYARIALEKWDCFVKRALEDEETIYLLDSSLFQYQIFTYLLKNAPVGELEDFIRQLLDKVSPLHPALLYLYRENAEDTIRFLEDLRGERFLEDIWRRDKAQPYYRDKPTGAKGQRQFLRDYARIAGRLFDRANCRKIGIEISGQDWPALEERMLSFLGLERAANHRAFPPDGIYRNEELGFELEVKGLSLTDPTGKERALIAQSDRAFYVDCLPVILRFDETGGATVCGDQICERWTTTGSRFVKV